MNPRVTNPRLDDSEGQLNEFLELAGSGQIPLHDEKNDGADNDDFVEVVRSAAQDRTKLGEYHADQPTAGRGTYPT